MTFQKNQPAHRTQKCKNKFDRVSRTLKKVVNISANGEFS